MNKLSLLCCTLLTITHFNHNAKHVSNSDCLLKKRNEIKILKTQKVNLEKNIQTLQQKNIALEARIWRLNSSDGKNESSFNPFERQLNLSERLFKLKNPVFANLYNGS